MYKSKSLEGFKEEDKMMQLIIWKDHSYCRTGKEAQLKKRGGQETSDKTIVVSKWVAEGGSA